MSARFLFSLLSLFLLFPSFIEARSLHHQIKATINPLSHQIQIENIIILPEQAEDLKTKTLEFSLHAGLNPFSTSPGLTLKQIKKDDSNPTDIPLEHYRVELAQGLTTFTLHYEGKIHHPLKKEGENYGRSFRETPGTISEAGIFLAGSTYWYPVFNETFITFDLEVHLPASWSSVSQGTRTFHKITDKSSTSRWHSPEEQEEIYLVAGQWTEYQRAAGKITAMAFLREADESLANKYLDATAQYLEMYQKLLGPYPYKKFALVENFWETGYGMPSFTLLGPKIIRMPFILHSSYPHEILHNWWGNGVYVDDEQGNWAEGLTTYLADHLIAEQREQGTRSRRASLQKYTDYVSKGKDFPLTAFRQRESAATEAVGYGKTLMFFHMLRLELGNDIFINALRNFYRTQSFKRAGFLELQHAFSKAAKKDLSDFFRQWIEKIGAPKLAIKKTKVQRNGDEFRLIVTLAQTQKAAPYSLSVPIAVTLKGQTKTEQITVSINKKEMTFSLIFPHRPIKLDIDPEFDLFRRLDRNEIPPALSLAFGATKILIVLPSNETGKLRGAYDELARGWQSSQTGKIEIQWDTEIKTLPSDRTIWLLGWKNRFRKNLTLGLKPFDVLFKSKQIQIAGKKIEKKGHSIVFTNRNSLNPDHALTWLATDNPAAIAGLGRKLPHYGRYSYLAFKGEAPTNVLKGLWPTPHSPLSKKLQRKNVARGELAHRPALATLPSLFSEERMMTDIRFLANDKMKGRGFGTKELEEAADYIRDQFQKAGLKPLGDQGTYFQTWAQKGGDPEKIAPLKNVVAMLPGNNTKYTGESVVVAAHYDHLGLGWPDAHAGDAGKVHPGADDNASGVAVLLELARTLGKSFRPERTIIFVAFSAEEMGTLGALHYLKTIKKFPAEKIMGMLNMDTVGRLDNKSITVFGGKSSTQWPHIFRGISFVTGISIDTVISDFNPSDQVRFHEASVPAVHLFSGANPDFHRPSDTFDKIDGAGLIKIARVMKEAIEYLSSRPDQLSTTLKTKQKKDAKSARPSARKVGIGTIPDFAYTEKGMRISGTIPGSPAEKAGLLAGDVIYWIGKNYVEDIRVFSGLLRKLKPGIPVSLTLLRGDQEMTLSIVPMKR